jgi:hypothetical protein
MLIVAVILTLNAVKGKNPPSLFAPLDPFFIGRLDE